MGQTEREEFDYTIIPAREGKTDNRGETGFERLPVASDTDDDERED
jgi:hypothetical protein